MKEFVGIGLALAAILTGLAVLTVGKIACRPAQVALQQLDPQRLLNEYERFKDQHAALASKVASIAELEAQVTALEDAYEGVPRKDWARDDRNAHTMATSAASGARLSFNNLAATYNANMAKINFKFCNVGELPAGATEPLPREYVTYISK